MELTQSYLKSILHYDPETGVFTWLPRRSASYIERGFYRTSSWNSRYANKPAGCASHGYNKIVIMGEQYLAHRLAFLYMTGEMPIHNTDHIDGDRRNNQWKNLRDVPQSDNLRNRKMQTTNTSGVMGVSWHKKRQKWRVVIMERHFGVFSNKEDAITVAKEKYKELGFHENHGRTQL